MNSVLLIDKPLSDKVYKDSVIRSTVEFNPESKGPPSDAIWTHVIWM